MVTCFKVNSPHIVHETIDGETIIMDLRTGNYYSIEWPGTFIWDFIAETGNTGILTDYISDEENLNQEVVSGITAFINALVKEGLLAECGNGAGFSEITDEFKREVKTLAQNFKTPEFNKHTDMQDMLLLDPIHDVDEKGWPEPKKDNE